MQHARVSPARSNKDSSIKEPAREVKAASNMKPAGAAIESPLLPTAEIAAFNGDPNFMTSLARGLAVICTFSQERKKQTIAQISHTTGIPRAAVRRCLYTLERLGYVAAEERSFSLRPKTLALGQAYLSSTPLAVSAQPLLDRVSAALHESCSLTVLDNDKIRYIARSKTTTRIMSVDLKVGSLLPAYCTSMGRVLLAHLPGEKLETYLARVVLEPLTERTIISKEKLSRTLEAVRRAGYASVDQELEIGLRSIAVPVADAAGNVVASINIGAQAGRVTLRDMQTRMLPPLQAAAAELGTLLAP